MIPILKDDCRYLLSFLLGVILRMSTFIFFSEIINCNSYTLDPVDEGSLEVIFIFILRIWSPANNKVFHVKGISYWIWLQHVTSQVTLQDKTSHRTFCWGYSLTFWTFLFTIWFCTGCLHWMSKFNNTNSSREITYKEWTMSG